MKKISVLRKKYPIFIYKSYSYKISKNNLEIFFNFRIDPDRLKSSSQTIFFKPKITIKNINKKRLSAIGDKILNNLIFHLGLMEIPSYWKITCSPKIEIQAGNLSKEQIKWWKDLILKGMGQFFYENKINFIRPDFLKILSAAKDYPLPLKKKEEDGPPSFLLKDRVLVPIGGGKDSVVTLEILKRAKKSLDCFFLNPINPAKKIAKIAGCKNEIIVERKIDKKLLELNQKGFLNGHTPFSAFLAFLSVVCATVFDYKYIAISQEQSSNQGNLKYLGKEINHQYSKSFDFEQKFRKYTKKYLSRDIEYFSFLRPLYEIQIAELFSNFQKYFSAFLSCNEAYKTYSGTKKPLKKWCCNCSKCLFVFTILYPFTDEQKLIKIFGENLFEKKSLLPIMKELTGEKGFKPFECVGTKKESITAFYLSLSRYRRQQGTSKKFSRDQVSFRMPFLLEYFEKKILPKYPNLEKESRKIMNSWNKQHNLPKNLEIILKS